MNPEVVATQAINERFILLGINQSSLARELKVSQATISSFVNGKRVNGNTFVTLAGAVAARLSMPLSEVITDPEVADKVEHLLEMRKEIAASGKHTPAIA